MTAVQSNKQTTEMEMAADERKAYILFVAIGIGYLFPFSALTQPVDYWHELFPDFNVEFSITVTYMWLNLLVLAFLVFVGNKPIFKQRKLMLMLMLCVCVSDGVTTVMEWVQ
jgi:hypothetical protein